MFKNIRIHSIEWCGNFFSSLGNLGLNALSNGGADRDRTDDIKLAKLALSQLSYSPILKQRN